MDDDDDDHGSDVIFPPALLRMSGAIEKSTDVMKAMQGLIRIPEIQASMMDLSKEMSKVSCVLWKKYWVSSVSIVRRFNCVYFTGWYY